MKNLELTFRTEVFPETIDERFLYIANMRPNGTGVSFGEYTEVYIWDNQKEAYKLEPFEVFNNNSRQLNITTEKQFSPIVALDYWKKMIKENNNHIIETYYPNSLKQEENHQIPKMIMKK